MNTDILIKNGFADFRGIEQPLIYDFNGYLVATFIDIQSAKVEKPVGYNQENVEALLAGYTDMQTDEEELLEKPHVILIMNESFADLRVLGNLELSEENMGFFNHMDENTVRGFVNASVLGGGTANSEFEVLTGCSMGLLPPSYYAYQQCVEKPMESLVSIFKEQGYTALSIHPESKANWGRERVYRYFGFDKSLWRDDFKGAEEIHSGVSDLETYKKIEELYESREEGEKLFVFDITMQNHGDYTPKARESNYAISAKNINSAEADVYLSLIKDSDEAFRQLIQYFENQEEKVVICMFGDHQPKFGDESFYTGIYEKTPALSQTDILFNQYKTPFVIWANYDLEKQEKMDISMNYLGVLLLETLGIKGTPYFNYLGELMQEYPIITVNGYRKNNGEIYGWSGENEEFEDYRILQYYYLFDDETP